MTEFDNGFYASLHQQCILEVTVTFKFHGGDIAMPSVKLAFRFLHPLEATNYMKRTKSHLPGTYKVHSIEGQYKN